MAQKIRQAKIRWVDLWLAQKIQRAADPREILHHRSSCPPIHGARRGELETGGARGEDAGGADAFVTSAGADTAGSKIDPVGSAVEGAGESA